MTIQSGPIHALKRQFSSRVWRIVELILLLIGIALILHPWWDRYVQENQQLELLTQWETIREANEIAESQTSYTEHISENESAESAALEKQTNRQEELLMIDGEAIIGTISIGKIDLREPMLARTTEKTLKLGIGSVVTEAQPGENGNFVLAGHRSRTFGKQFNRLDELEEGDQITLETFENQYIYKVVSKFVVEPTGVYVLDQDMSEQELTLITCDPIRNPTHRLIIKATLLQTSIVDDSREVKPL